ncbi:hypothetical protein KEM56_003421, partial [Ascosphaera pollenicola]
MTMTMTNCTLTPLTTTAYPPPKSLSGPAALTTTKPFLTPLDTPSTNTAGAAGAGAIAVEVCRVIYDPDLDRKNPRDRRGKLQYSPFHTVNVTVTAAPTAAQPTPQPPPNANDPRLSVANYTRGAACKQKTKYRPAPYTLRPWAFDPSTSIGPGPPVQIVVTGFDPLTPVAHISALFSSFGEIAEIKNRTDPMTGRFLG